jgi:hypothetical protein
MAFDGRKVPVDGGDSLVLEPVSSFQAAIDAADDVRGHILDFVTEHQPASRSKIEKGVAGRALAVRQTLDALVHEGALIEQGGERNARLYSRPTESSS